jgi:hypothetical protein
MSGFCTKAKSELPNRHSLDVVAIALSLRIRLLDIVAMRGFYGVNRQHPKKRASC